MSIGALDAVSAYGRALGSIAPKIGGGLKPASIDSQAGGFGGMVEAMISNTAGTMHAAETASAKQVAGKGDLIDVVTAIGAAETALDTMVAVRDRVVNAYSDIMRMQI